MSKKTCLRPLVAAITAVLTVSPHVLQAQALEEIVVTAQRRTQSLQEVPISLEAISSAELTRQGYRDLNSLSAFSPTVNVDQEAVIGPTISIRGFGTSGNAVTLESATPIFVDGIHYSRMSMMKTAFMDVEQVEVLKGPQPVYFGQNAIAGAFNITSKKPGDTWEGDLDFEFGNRNTQEVNGGIGGPINDQWRMRIAGKYEDAGGYLNDILTGDDLGAFEDIGGRFTLQWLPSDQLVVTAKVDYSQIRKDVEAVHMCLTEGGDMIYGRNGPGVGGANGAIGNIGQEDSIFAAPPVGEGWNNAFSIPLDNDCYGSRNGVSAGGPYYPTPDNVREENSEFGALDVRAAAEGFAKINNKGISGYEDIDIWTSALRFEYEFANGIALDFNNGYVRYLRNYVRDNSYSYQFLNFQGREEDYYQWSSELRLDSEKGGMIEWNISGFYQTGDLDVFSSSLRADLRTPQRYNDVWEDQEWFAGSGVFTFNFLDNRASIDVGARVAKLNKTTYADGYAGTWVYNVMPCDPESLTQAQRDNPTAANIAACTGTHADAAPVAEAQVDFMTDDPYDPANLWAISYGTSGDQKRLVPPNWLPSQAHAIGLTKPDYAARRAAEGRDGALIGDFGRTEVDPQVTLRYRPTDDISVYAKWAESSKAGGYDTGQTSLSPVGYEFEPEYAETYEIGTKGTFMDGRGRFDASLFTLEFTDLQISVATSDPDNPFINLNAGSQRVRGLEFGTQFAVSDRMEVGFGGAILDGEFTNFPNSTCTIVESNNADTGPCVSEAESAEITGIPVGDDGSDAFLDTIDRTGTKTPRTPDWKFIADLNYWMPVFDSYKITFNAKGYYSDGYTTDFEGFTETTRFDKHGDLNLVLGFGDQNDVWSVSLYGRNLFQARPTYHQEFDLENDGQIQTPVSPNYYATYGVKLTYNYQ